MGTPLTGNSVGSSYQGLLKTTDNAAIDGTLKNMTDGAGNATPLSMANDYVQLQAPTIELIESTGGTNLMMISPTNVYFEGAVDFTNATVTGIGGGGGATPAPFVSYANGLYSTGTDGPYTFFSNRILFYAIRMDAGQTLTNLDFEVTTAFATAQIGFALYTSQNTTNANAAAYVPHEQLANLGTVDGTTVGIKNLTGFSVTSTYAGLYFIGIQVPGVWDGAFRSYNLSFQIGSSDQRVYNTMQYGGIPGTFFGPFNQIVQQLIDTDTAFQATYPSNKTWSTTSAEVFACIRT